MCEKVDDYASEIRSLIIHENELTNHRLTWLMVIQGFLFGAVGLVYSEKVTGIYLVYLMGVVGILSSLSCFIPLQAAHLAIESLQNTFNDKYPSYSGAPIIGLPSELWGKEVTKDIKCWCDKGVVSFVIDYLRPSLFLPLLLELSWVALIFFESFRNI